MAKDKNITWADLKRVANKIPASRLKDDVTIWTDDEQCFKVADIERLTEDYVFDGDEGCAPRGAMKETIAESKKEGFPNEHYVVYPKGTRIINATH